MYIIFLADNKRLDEWVCEDKLDIEHLQLPRKDCKTQSALIKAPLSRAGSPDVAGVITPTHLLAGDPVRRTSIAGRKRKLETEVCLE